MAYDGRPLCDSTHEILNVEAMTVDRLDAASASAADNNAPSSTVVSLITPERVTLVQAELRSIKSQPGKNLTGFMQATVRHISITCGVKPGEPLSLAETLGLLKAAGQQDCRSLDED